LNSLTATKTEQPPKSPRYSKDHFERYAERGLKLDYAMVRFPKSEVAFKTRDQDPAVWFTVKHIPQRNQVALHVRVPVRDDWNNLTDHLDLDIYFPKDQLAEMTKVLTEPAKNERLMKIQKMTFTRRDLERVFGEYLGKRP
jgi:hypothetical protein